MTNKFAIVVLSLIVLLAWTPPASLSAVGKAPDFSLKDLSGKMVHLKDFIGKKVIVMNFWATWCVPCKLELPHMEKIHKKFKDKDFVLLSINTDLARMQSTVKDFVKRYKMTYTVLVDPEAKAVSRYNPRGIIPYTVVIDLKGNIHKIYHGYIPGIDKQIEKEVLKLLESAPAE